MTNSFRSLALSTNPDAYWNVASTSTTLLDVVTHADTEDRTLYGSSAGSSHNLAKTLTDGSKVGAAYVSEPRFWQRGPGNSFTQRVSGAVLVELTALTQQYTPLMWRGGAGFGSTSSTSWEFGLRKREASNNWAELYFMTVDPSNGLKNYWVTDSSSTFSLNQGVLLAFTWDAVADTVHIWGILPSGIIISSEFHPGHAMNTSSGLGLIYGANRHEDNSSGSVFTGNLDDAMFYTRALVSTDIDKFVAAMAEDPTIGYRIYNLKTQILYKSPIKYRVYGIETQILYKRIPYHASPVGQARASASANVGISLLNFGHPSGKATARATATIAAQQTTTADGVSPNVRRWVFFEEDTGDQWQLTVNPNQMDSIPVTKTVDTTVASFGNTRPRTIQTPTSAPEWSFSGVNLTRDQYKTLNDWVMKPGVIMVRDHFGHVYRVLFEDLTFAPPAGRRRWDYKMKYTVKTRFLERTR